MQTLTKVSALIASVVVATTVAAVPQYQIYDIGVVQVGDTASQGFGVSTGGVAVGRSFRTNATQAFSWTRAGGLVGLPNLAGRAFAVSNSANDSGTVVGTGATTAFGSGRLPIVWQNGVVSQLPLPGGETLGDANHVNASGVAVGSVNAGSLQRGVIYSGGSATVISQTTSIGCFFLTAFGINDSGRIVGQGIDPNNAARNVGIVYDIGAGSAIEVGALPGLNGALAFGVSNPGFAAGSSVSSSGFVTGSSMMNQGSGLPFIWSEIDGMVAVPLATGTSQGSGRAVNSHGMVVGTDSSAFAIPFLYDGTATYRLADIIPAGTGWDLSTNTSSSALGISDNGIIVGTGVFNGAIHGYAMLPLLQPTSAVSRLTHAGAGSFDIDMPLMGTTGVECRNNGGNYTLIVTFSNTMVSGGASVIGGTGSVVGSPTFSGHTMTINLTGVINAQTLTISLTNLTDTFSQVIASATLGASFLIGDSNGDRIVNAGDAVQTRGRSGQATDATNFRSDVNLDGLVNSGDTAIVRANSGSSVIGSPAPEYAATK